MVMEDNREVSISVVVDISLTNGRREGSISSTLYISIFLDGDTFTLQKSLPEAPRLGLNPSCIALKRKIFVDLFFQSVVSMMALNKFY
jgi:hypothetical protein